MAVLAVLAAVAPAIALTTTSPVRAAGGPGCAGARPAVAHYGGGLVLDPQPSPAPVPCGVSTGYAGAEDHVVVTGTGQVIYLPAVVPSGLLGTGEVPVGVDPNSQNNASPAGMALSSDEGANWSLVKPLGVTWNPTDHALYVDRATGRLFFEDYTVDPSQPALGPYQTGFPNILWTDDPAGADPGHAWHRTVLPPNVLPENPRFAAAVAPAGQPQPTGYANVVYFCTNTNVGFTSPVILGRACYRSLDGGSTWQERSVLFTGTGPQHRECAPNGETYSAIDGYYPQPANDGSLYVMVACGGVTYLARSTDEAATFPVVHAASGQPVTLPVPAGASPELRVDPSDNFYLAYQVGQKLFLAVSTDLGRTWSQPVDLTAPGVTLIYQWQVAERGAGEVAVSYTGQTNGQTQGGSPVYDGYLTATTDALDAAAAGPGPLFWSGMLNDPATPVLYGPGIQGAGVIDVAGTETQYPFPLGGAGNDFIDATIGPDGTPWASFDRDCGPSPKAPGCQADNAQTRGFAGRLAGL